MQINNIYLRLNRNLNWFSLTLSLPVSLSLLYLSLSLTHSLNTLLLFQYTQAIHWAKLEFSSIAPVDRLGSLVVIAPARGAGDPG